MENWRVFQKRIYAARVSVASVERAFKLLHAVRATDGTISALSRATNLPVATVSRLMGSLERAGAVLRNGKAYRIGPTVAELADADAVGYDLVALATAHLSDLAAASGETAGIAEAVGDDLVHLAQVATDHDVAVRDWTGVRVPAHSGCIGFVLMAWWPEDQVAGYLAQDLEPFSPQTMTDAAAIQKRLAAIRKNRALWTTDEYAVGVTTVAAAVRDKGGRPVAAVHVHGPSFRFPEPERRAEIESLVRERAQAISSVLGWRADD